MAHAWCLPSPTRFSHLLLVALALFNCIVKKSRNKKKSLIKTHSSQWISSTALNVRFTMRACKVELRKIRTLENDIYNKKNMQPQLLTFLVTQFYVLWWHETHVRYKTRCVDYLIFWILIAYAVCILMSPIFFLSFFFFLAFKKLISLSILNF